MTLRVNSILIASLAVLAASPALAQPRANSLSGWGYGDAAPTSFGVEGGINYGGRVTVGVAAGVFHPYRLNRITPEVEAYLGLTAEISHYNLWVYVGGGVYTDPDPTWTGRLSLWWYDSRPLGLYAGFYGMWTPAQGNLPTASYLLQPRLGLEIKVADHWQIIPYLQLAITVPDSTVSVGPGVLVFWSS